MSNLVVLARSGRFIERVLCHCAGIGFCAFFAICLASPHASAQQFQQHDIGGVKVGMSLSATKAAIAKVNPKYDITEIKGNGGQVIALQAIVGFDFDKTDDEFLAVLGDTGVTWFIGRWQKPAEPMLLETLDDALKKKYGSPSSTDRSVWYNSILLWYFDRQGKQATHENCGRQSGTGSGIGGLRTNLAPPSSFSSVCGGVIGAYIKVEAKRFNDKQILTIPSFFVQIAEVKSQYDKASSRDEAAAREKQLREEKEREELLKKANKAPSL